MSNALGVYLDDHLGGAQIALAVLKSMRDEHSEEQFRALGADLFPQIAQDDDTLRSIVQALGRTPSTTKQISGWVFEKMSRAKLGHTGSKDFTLFESLELLCLGITGKLLLWKALEAASASEPALSAWNFKELIARAQSQFGQVEEARLALAPQVLLTRSE